MKLRHYCALQIIKKCIIIVRMGSSKVAVDVVALIARNIPLSHGDL